MPAPRLAGVPRGRARPRRRQPLAAWLYRAPAEPEGGGRYHHIATGEGWLYVAILMDLYARRMIGWAMEDHLTTALTSAALEMALQQRGIPTGLLHHSDRGWQDTATAYQQRLFQLRIQCSMSRPGNCWDRASSRH